MSEVLAAGLRLEASAFSIDARRVAEELRASGLPLRPLYGAGGLCQEAHNAFRFRRTFVAPDRGIPFLSSSDIIAFRPDVWRYVSRTLTKGLETLLIRPWDVLISCSGTIGNVALAGSSVAGMALSQDAIRLRAADPELAGYVTAFLRSRLGRVQLTQATYGSVIVHIEPEHLTRIVVPELHPIHRVAIGRAMREAVEARDQANVLLARADALLHERLRLAPLEAAPDGQSSAPAVVRASRLADRLDAHYHHPQTGTAEARLAALAVEVAVLGDRRVTREIRPITKFRKRVYVREGGIPLLSSKQLFQVDPVDVKGLAKGAHTKDLEEIALEADMIAVTRSGTIGRVQIIPAYMAGWAASEHATRVLAADDMDAGYLYAWLASDYGTQLITRFSYGSVILQIDADMLARVPVPMPAADIRAEIGSLVREANALRNAAWRQERAAIAQLETIAGAPAAA